VVRALACALAVAALAVATLSVVAVGCVVDTRGLAGSTDGGAGRADGPRPDGLPGAEGGAGEGGAGVGGAGAGPDGAAGRAGSPRDGATPDGAAGAPCNCAGGCAGGSCAPIAATSTHGPSPNTLAFQGDTLYFIDQSARTIRRMRPGGATSALLSDVDAYAIGANATYFFWATGSGLFRCNLPDCSTRVRLADDVQAGTVLQMAADASLLAWVTGPDLVAGQVKSCDPNACTVLGIADGQHRPMGIALDGGFVYWTTHGTGGGNDGTIRRSPRGMAWSPGDFVAGVFAPRAIVVTPGHLYWSAGEGQDDGQIKRCALGAMGCGATEGVTTPTMSLDDPLRRPVSLVVDATHAFFTSETGTIMTCPLTGCASNPGGLPIILARGLSMPAALTDAGSCLYLIDYGGADGRVLGFGKPARCGP